MKKLVSCIIAVAMILSMVTVTTVGAASQINASYNPETCEITINGVFPETHGTLTVIVSKYDEANLNSYDDLTKANIGANVIQMTTWDGTGNKVLKVSAPAGYYIVFCGGKGVSPVAQKVLYITNAIEQNAAVNAFKTATAETVGAVITEYSVEKPIVSLNVGNSVYVQHTQDVHKAFVNIIADEVARLESLSPAGALSSNDISVCFDKATALVDFNTSTDKAGKLESYKDILGLTITTDANTHKAVAATLILSQSEAVEGKILSQLDFVKAFDKAVAICVINSSTRETIKENLLAYDNVIGIDAEDGYEKADESKLNAAMAFGTHTKTEDIVAAFNAAVIANPKPAEGNTQTGTQSGKLEPSTPSGNFGGQTVIGRPTTAPEAVQPPVVTAGVFTDISDYTWAHDAIKYLSTKNVLNGVGEGKFEPARSIKREEYAKIMVEAFGLSSKGEAKDFADVAQGVWYYDYVNIAYQNGLITGMDEQNFGTGSFVTRQDAAVIIYRYLLSTGYKFAEQGEDFDDIDVCADYAKEAIRALKNSGLINGSGNNCFTPDEQLNRAQAAVMVYNIINAREAK